jgi:hypothetical protein
MTSLKAQSRYFSQSYPFFDFDLPSTIKNRGRVNLSSYNPKSDGPVEPLIIQQREIFATCIARSRKKSVNFDKYLLECRMLIT